MKEIIPLESTEQAEVVRFMDARGLQYFHVPNETFTKSWSQKAMNKKLGVKSGVPDLFVFCPHIVAIEMKRRKGGRLSDSQKRWAEVIRKSKTPWYVAEGAREAIHIIISEAGSVPDIDDPFLEDSIF